MSKSSSKEKDKIFEDAIRKFFKTQKLTNCPLAWNKREKFDLTPEILHEIGPENTNLNRFKALQSLSETAINKRFEENAVESIWNAISDLLRPSTATEFRQNALSFVSYLVCGQFEQVVFIRPILYTYIESHNVREDVELRFVILKALCNFGRDISNFEEKIGPLLCTMMVDLLRSNHTTDFLILLTTLIKYNSAHVEEPAINFIVNTTCLHICSARVESEITYSILLLDACVRYCSLYPKVLEIAVSALCRCITYEAFHHEAWKVMAHILGTHLGDRAICTLCQFMQADELVDDAILLEGSVYVLGHGLWGPNRNAAIYNPPISVVPCLKLALRGKSWFVATEVAAALNKLLTLHGTKLSVTVWDLILDCAEKVVEICLVSKPTSLSIPRITDVIMSMESLSESSEFLGSAARLYNAVENWAEFMPEPSVLRLLRYRALEANPHRADWLVILNQMVERFYNQETRTNVRMNVLKILTEAVEDARPNYEEDIMQKIIVPLFNVWELGSNADVSRAAVEFLLLSARICTTKCCLEILPIVEKILSKSFDSKKEEKCQFAESDIAAIQTAALGLIDLCKFKIHHLPPLHAIQIFKILVTHLHTSYRADLLFDSSGIRSKILEFILSLRCNSYCEVGFATETEPKPEFSKFLVYTSANTASFPSEQSSSSSASTLVAFVFPMEEAIQALNLCLQKDRDWLVLQLVFNKLPTFLQNRSIILSVEGAIGQLCVSMCNIIGDRNLGLPNSLTNMPGNFSRSEFHCHALPVLPSLVTYHKQLEALNQRKFVKCLEFGLVSKCARSCITALTLCILEMHETMYKVLPAVLLGLSKISATVGISVAILEFLSSLIRLPRLYASFVEDQYMSIFAIALPYVNPFKFAHNTVALGYHVIAMWFLKCRLPFRREFVKFIIKGLQSNVLVPFEEGTLSPNLLHLSVDDPTHRRRASTMNEQSLIARRKDARAALVSSSSMPISENRPAPSAVPVPDKKLNVELTETCVDLLSRYTFACFSAIPKRFSASEFLLNGGQSLTWLVGTKLVTVTTSGCSNKAMKNGLCDKCLALCKGEREKSAQSARRRHQSAHQPSNISEPAAAPPRTKDDLQLQRPSSMDAALGQSLSTEDLDAQNLDRLLLSGLQEGVTASSSMAPLRPHLCNCWCQGWAEILVRRPTGNVSWMMRVQNSPHPVVTNADFPLADITTLFLPTREKSQCESYEEMASHRRINSETLEEKEYEKIFLDHFSPVASSESAKTDPHPQPEATGPNVQPEAVRGLSGAPDGDKPPVLLRSTSSPDLSSLACRESSRVTRVNSDVAYTSQQSRQRAISLLKAAATKSHLTGTGTGTGSQPQTKEEDKAKEVKPREEKPKEEKAREEKPKEEKPKKKTKDEEGKPKVHLRRNLSQREDERRPGSSLSRRGSERSVHFERKSIHSLPPSPSPNLTHSMDEPFRDRGHTISVANPAYRSVNTDATAEDKFDKDLHRSGTNPSFVFLQLYHDSCFGTASERPLLLPKTDVYERALKCFDRIPPYETHKIGVVYIGKGQVNNEAAILANEWGSMRYTEFVHGLGRVIRLQEVDPQTTYIGGLSRNGEDGDFAYIWQDDVMQVIFHVATLMPSKANDASCVSKKLHIGNDYVAIVYNDSGEEFDINTIKGQFMYACVVIQPLDNESNLIGVIAKPNFIDFLGGPTPKKIISNGNLPILARQLALHANLASMIFQSQVVVSDNPYASNWLERLRDLKRLRRKLNDEVKLLDPEDLPSGKAPSKFDNMQDFTDYV